MLSKRADQLYCLFGFLLCLLHSFLFEFLANALLPVTISVAFHAMQKWCNQQQGNSKMHDTILHKVPSLVKWTTVILLRTVYHSRKKLGKRRLRSRALFPTFNFREPDYLPAAHSLGVQTAFDLFQLFGSFGG